MTIPANVTEAGAALGTKMVSKPGKTGALGGAVGGKAGAGGECHMLPTSRQSEGLAQDVCSPGLAQAGPAGPSKWCDLYTQI